MEETLGEEGKEGHVTILGGFREMLECAISFGPLFSTENEMRSFRRRLIRVYRLSGRFG